MDGTMKQKTVAGWVAAVLVGILALSPAVVGAEPMPSGEYSGTGDGAEMSIVIDGDRFEVSVGGPGCMGFGKGEHIQTERNTWLAVIRDENSSCELSIVKKGRQYLIEERSGCMYFHGASCGFSGTVK